MYGGPMTPEMAQQQRWAREIEARNRPWSLQELDDLFPPTGYKILEQPASYVPVTPSRKATATPTPMATPGFTMADTPGREEYGVPAGPTEGAGRCSCSEISATALQRKHGK